MSCRQLDGTQADINECLKFAKAMPAITQRCQLPCQDDCQLTNWSKFSSCTADCVGVRTRKRALIGGKGERGSRSLLCFCLFKSRQRGRRSGEQTLVRNRLRETISEVKHTHKVRHIFISLLPKKMLRWDESKSSVISPQPLLSFGAPAENRPRASRS